MQIFLNRLRISFTAHICNDIQFAGFIQGTYLEKFKVGTEMKNSLNLVASGFLL
jgi:hypothetical protein